MSEKQKKKKILAIFVEHNEEVFLQFIFYSLGKYQSQLIPLRERLFLLHRNFLSSFKYQFSNHNYEKLT